ncbi:unnamed protein product [Cyprideis torosa]|uniref:Uncharacterized protein n=1 Tax=Cyprideis torosa TaxID=163714 RepID=A0A7R8ZP44_9CRUS|nr:unnamed protein product [Cyprideis torosa]CAG0897887.1 unnamed protein product [Cyprideis torosa]
MAPAVIQQTPKSDEENFPYKATQMWYQTIEDFRRGMPRRTHWFLLKQYEETFTGNEAVTWMRAHLASRPEFTGTVGGVRKEQAIGLLRKFLKAGVFERVRSSASAGPFKDNSEIYRMTNQSPATVIRTPGRPPLASRENQTAPSSLMKPRQLVEEMVAKTNRLFSQDKENQEERNEVVATEEIKECHLVLRPLTAFQREELWRRALLVRLQFTLCHGESLPPISGAWVAHNCTKLSPKGTTLPLPRASPEPLLPSWVLQAMKCLAHWPNPEYGTELPSYAGFVTDVFHVVSDYFYQQPEPLIALDLYPCVRNAFERAEVIDSKWRLHRRGWQGGEYVDSEKLRRWGTDSKSSLSPPHQLSSILPPNSCLEAAFTSDHPPHYRVIPRSSVDSLHLSSSGSSLPLQAAEGEHSTPTTAGEKSAALRGKETSRAPHQRHVSEPAPSSNPEGVGCALSSNPTGNQVSEVSPVKIWTKSCSLRLRQRNYAFVKHRAPSRPASTMKCGHSPPPMRPQNGIHARTRSASGDLLSQKSRRLGGLVPFSRSSLVNRGQSTSSFKPSVVVAAKNSYSGGHYSPITPSRGNYISYCPLGNDLNAVGSKGGYVNLALDPGDTPPPSSEIKEFFRGMNMNSTRESSGIGSIEDGLAPSTPGSLSPRCSDTLGGGPVPIQPMRRPPPPPFIPPPDPITKPTLMAFPDESQIENHKATPAVAVLEERRPSAPNYELMRSDGLLTPEGNAQALQSLRLLLLMLHPDQRRRLQLLIRMMARMVNNKELVLPGTGSKEDLLLTTFSGGILRSQTENVRAHDSDIATKVVRFIVKNHEELFRPPPDLVQEVQKKIENGQQSTRVTYESLDSQQMTFCQKITREEYERQRMTGPPHQLSSILPPNSCLEAAFTSDHPPHYRVIPRSSVDSLHLSSSGSSLPLQAAEGEHSTPTTAGEKSAALRGKETSRAPHQRHVSEPAPSSNPEGVGCALSSNPTGNQVSEVSPVKIWTKRERRGSGDYTVIAYSSSSSSGMHTSSDVSATIHASSTREADRQRNYAFVKHRAPSRPASTMKRGHSPPPMRQQNGIHARTRSASGDLLSQKSRRLGGLVPFSRSSLVNRGQSTSSFKPSVVVAAKNSYSGGHYSPITPSRGNYISYCPLGNDLNAVGSKGGYVNLALDPGDTPPPSSEIKEFFRGMNMNSTRESSGIGSIEDGLAPSTPGSLSPRCSDTLGGGPVPIQPMRRPPPPPFIPPPDPITKPALMAFPDESQIENHKATPAVAVLEERRPSAPNYELMRSDGLLTPEGNAQALQSLRLLLLMLHPDQRRRLQLLIRMMARMVNNKELVLPGTGSKEDLLLTTFSGGILRSQTENVRAHDSDIATKVVRFLVKNHEELFRPPPDLVQEVQKKIEDGQQSTRVTYESLDSQQMTFCQKITREEYERQRMTGSQMALYDLLGQILEDETIGEKMRAKKLKKFKKQYPEIYAQKFPDSQLPRSKRHSFAPKFNFKI